jgi:hypothetical protein
MCWCYHTHPSRRSARKWDYIQYFWNEALPSIQQVLDTDSYGRTLADCRDGSYLDATSSLCVECPAGTSSAAGSDEATDCKCLAGYTAGSDGVECTACDAGLFKTGTGAGNCLPCDAGTYKTLAGAGGCCCPLIPEAASLNLQIDWQHVTQRGCFVKKSQSTYGRTNGRDRA